MLASVKSASTTVVGEVGAGAIGEAAVGADGFLLGAGNATGVVVGGALGAIGTVGDGPTLEFMEIMRAQKAASSSVGIFKDRFLKEEDVLSETQLSEKRSRIIQKRTFFIAANTFDQ